jgi:hypothetical protein
LGAVEAGNGIPLSLVLLLLLLLLLLPLIALPYARFSSIPMT